MKKMFRSLTAIGAVVFVSALATSCKKEVVEKQQTSQGLRVYGSSYNNNNLLIGVGKKGVSQGPGITLSFEAYDKVIHVKSITFDVVSISSDPITAISIGTKNTNNNNVFVPITSKSVKNKTVTITGDFPVLPGVLETSYEVLPSYAGIGSTAISGSHVALVVSRIIFLSEQDGLTGDFNPLVNADLGTIAYSIPFVNLSGWIPGTSSQISMPTKKGFADFAVVWLSTNLGTCEIGTIPLAVRLEGIFLDQSKKITVRDQYGVVATTTVLTTSGSDFLINLPQNYAVTGNNSRYLVLSGVVDSLTPNAPRSITTTNSNFNQFVWNDKTGGGVSFSGLNTAVAYYDNGYWYNPYDIRFVLQ
jgi:hypothetical protein